MPIPEAVLIADRPTTRHNVYVFGATSFLNDTASEAAYWIIPAFLVTLGAGPAQLGIIEGIAESAASFAKLFSGRLTDRLARLKPMVVFGYALANVVKPVLAMATAWWQVLIIRFADRTAKGIRGAPRDVMLAESTEREKIGGAFGLLQSMDSAGAIVGPLLALAVLNYFHSGVRAVFWAAAIPGLLSIAIVALFAKETRNSPIAVQLATSSKQSSADEDGLTTGSSQLQQVRLPGNFYYVLAAVTLFSLGNSSDMFLILRAQNAGIPAVYAPLLGLVFNAVYTLASWPAGKLSDKAPKPLIAAAGYGIFAAVYFVFALAPSRVVLLAALAGYGFYYALTDPVLRALIAQTIVPEARGRALGIFFFVTSLATLLSSVMTGQLWKHFGAPLPFHLSAALAMISATMLFFVPRKSPM